MSPGRIGDDEDRHAVNQAHARGQAALGIELGGLLAAHRHVIHQDFRAAVAQKFLDILGGGTGAVGDDEPLVLGEAEHVLGHAVEDVAHGHLDVVIAELVVEHLGVVGQGKQCLVQWPADLAPVNVDGGDDLDVADGVPAQVDMLQAHSGGGVDIGGIRIIMNALNQGRGTVARAGNGYANLAHLQPRFSL